MNPNEAVDATSCFGAKTHGGNVFVVYCRWRMGGTSHITRDRFIAECFGYRFASQTAIGCYGELAWLSFCKVVRENYLHPLRDVGLQIVQIDMRDSRTIVDFDGSSSTQDAWVRKYGIKLAPTVLFFGIQGHEVAARLKGAYLPDFLWGLFR